MIIDQLPAVSAVQETDEIPVERGTTTYKATLQKLKALPQNESGPGYCKMPDGTLIQWGRINLSNVPISNAWGALYESGSQPSGVTFPIPFVEYPACSATANMSPAAWIEGMSASYTSLGNFFLVRPTSVASSSGHVDWIAVGRWK